MAFTSVGFEQVGIVGQLGYQYDNDKVAFSCVNLSGTAIPPGRGVLIDTANSAVGVNAVKLPAGNVTNFKGICYDDATLPIEEAGFPNDSVLPVLTRGRVWVLTSEAVAEEDPVYLQHTANGGSKPVGSFRTDNDGGDAGAVSNCKWAGSYSSGKALLIINQP